MALWGLAFGLGSCGVPVQTLETPASALRASDSEEALQACQDVRDYLDNISTGEAVLRDAINTAEAMDAQLVTLHALMIRASTGTVNDTQRADLYRRYQSGVATYDALASSAEAYGVGLFDGSAGAPAITVVDDEDYGDVAIPLADLTAETWNLNDSRFEDSPFSAIDDIDYTRLYVQRAESALYATMEVLGQNETRLNRELIRCGLEDIECVSASTSECSVFLDDPIADYDRSELLEALSVNLAEAQAVMAAATGATDQMMSALTRMAELAELASGTMDPADRADANAEFQSLTSSMEGLAASGTAYGIEMTTGDEEADFLVWYHNTSNDMVYAYPSDLGPEALGMDAGLNLDTESEASTALSAVENARDDVYYTSLDFLTSEVQVGVSAERVSRALRVWP